MPLSSVIREKRKEIGLTQEQVAEYLGVSAPAVNKWEKGTTYPDITLLPPLARLLKVDLNTLLCFNDGLTEQEIGHFCKQVMDAITKGEFEQGLEMVMEKIREYPNSASLIQSAAMLLDGALIMSGLDRDDKVQYSNQILALYERAASCDDSQIRDRAIFMLASKYISRDEYGKAQEMLDSLPERNAADKRQLQANLWIKQGKLTEAAELLERKLLLTVSNEIQIILIQLADIAQKEGNGHVACELAELSRNAAKLLGLCDYYSFIAPLQVAVAQENIPDSLGLLNSILASTLTPWVMNVSPLYRHIPVREGQESLSVHILPALLAEIKSDPKYAFLYKNTEFQQMIIQYERKADRSSMCPEVSESSAAQ